MKLFVNEGVFKRTLDTWKKIGNIEQVDNGVEIQMPVYSIGNFQETLEIFFEGINIDNLKKSKMYAVEFKSSKKKLKYNFYKGSKYGNHMMALLRSLKGTPNDVYIKRNKAKKIKVIKKFVFDDRDYGYCQYKGTIYLIEIMLKRNEQLEVFLGNGGTILRQKYIFSRDVNGEYDVIFEEGKEECILIHGNEKYIKLSEWWEFR